MLAANTPSGSKFNVLRRTFAAGQEYTFQADCHFVYFQEASFGFDVAFDNGPYIPMNLALGFRCAEGEAITSVSIKNTLSVDSSFVLVYGRGTIIDQRLNVLESRNGSSASLIPNGFVETTDVIASGDDLIVSANPNRESLIVSFERVTGASFVAGDEIEFRDSATFNTLKKVKFHSTPADTFVTPNFEYISASLVGKKYVFSLTGYSGEVAVFNNTPSSLDVKVMEKVYL